VAAFASMCPRCGHRADKRGGAVVIGGVPVFGSRRKGVFSLVARRLVTMLILCAAVAGVFLLSHVSRPQNMHEVDDQEEQCRAIEDSGEEFVGQLSQCQMKLARLRLIEHARNTPAPTLDSTHQAP